jgi:hypothetical protein
MGTFTVTHEIRCDEATFWRVFFDKEFNQKLFREALGFPEFEVVDQRETETELVRKVAGMPKMNMPGPVAKLLGSNFRYTELGTFDKAKKLWRWKMTPSVMAEKLRQEGQMHIEPAGDGRVRRIARMDNEAKVFGVGGLIESSAEKQLREGWDASAHFMNRYIETFKPA